MPPLHAGPTDRRRRAAVATAATGTSRSRSGRHADPLGPPSPASPATESLEARLTWRGRRWAPGEDAPRDNSPHVRTTEWTAGGGAEEKQLRLVPDAAIPDRDAGLTRAGAFRLVHGDALDVARALGLEGHRGKVDLVYLDPPFASRMAYTHEARLDGPADGRVVRARAYDDRWGEGVAGYLDMLAPRLEALAGLLSPQGSIWVHVDWRASYLVRLLLDEILGRDAFKNEIVWRRAPNLGRQAASRQFGRTLDTIIVYGSAEASLVPPTRLEPVAPAAIRRDEQGRPFTTAPRGDYTDESIRRLDAEGRVHRTATGKVYVKYFLVKNAEGLWCRERRVDTLWTDVAPLRHASTGERTGFPTQKPRALLDRIVACASPPGGLVVDLFAGSGTTGESAHALGRRFVLGDASPLAVAAARARLLRAGVPLEVQACDGVELAPQGPPPVVQVVRRGAGARVVLVEPREPLAWAIDVAHDALAPGGPFRTAWHSERTPGARAVRAADEAALERAPGPIAVRVWYDDGRVGARVVEPA
jgi:DNA modification methylase